MSGCQSGRVHAQAPPRSLWKHVAEAAAPSFLAEDRPLSGQQG